MLPSEALLRLASELGEDERLELVRSLLGGLTTTIGLETRARGYVVYRDPQLDPYKCSAFFSFAGVNLSNARLLGALYFIALVYIFLGASAETTIAPHGSATTLPTAKPGGRPAEAPFLYPSPEPAPAAAHTFARDTICLPACLHCFSLALLLTCARDERPLRTQTRQ